MQVTEPMGKVTTYTYDNNGNKLTEAVNGHTTSYQYDAMNRVILITYPTTPATTMSYTYDFRSNVIDMTDQSGHVTHNEYDLAGRLVAVKDTGQPTPAEGRLATTPPTGKLQPPGWRTADLVAPAGIRSHDDRNRSDRVQYRSLHVDLIRPGEQHGSGFSPISTATHASSCGNA